jgi:predicted nuclease of predicted toxin-antitoxin system
MLTSHQKFNCPLCHEVLGPWSRGITLHTKNMHGLELWQLWLIKNELSVPPKCKCCESCTSQVSWKNWESGFSEYAKGHYDKRVRSELTKISQKKSHWSRGKSKETDERLKGLSVKVSKTLKEKFKSGEIKHWAKDQTKLTSKSLEMISQASLGNKYNSYSSDELVKVISEKIKNNFELITQISDIESRINNRKSNVEIKCLRCNDILSLSFYNLIRKKLQRCNNCDMSTSNFEKEIGDYVESLGIKIKRRSYVNGIEIDILVKEHNLGIECNGLYWHSDAVNKDKFKHQTKSDKCLKRGVRLIHIFEDEWFDKQSACKNLINNGLKKWFLRLKSSDCVFKTVLNDDAKAFFQLTHLDNEQESEKFYGLFQSEQLKMCIGINLKQNNILEITKISSDSSVFIENGFDKLIKGLQAIYSDYDIVSNVDLRYEDGSNFEKFGFEKIYETEIKSWKTDTIKRFLTENSSQINTELHKRLFTIHGCKNIVYFYAKTI